MRHLISTTGRSRWKARAGGVVLAAGLLLGTRLVEAADPPRPPGPFQPADVTKLDAKVLFRAEYTCKDSQSGTGCSAGCGTASFSPIIKLTVILLSLRNDPRGSDMLYYLAQLPESPNKKEKSTKTEKSANSVMRAEGFTMDTQSVCGTVNMMLELLPD